jgi:hypothetical protein
VTYSTIAAMAQNSALFLRLTAAAAGEHKPKPYAEWVQERLWDFASTPGWALAWESALAGHPDDPEYDPGADNGVITDGMILPAVQPME